MSANFTMTRNQIIEKALRRIQVFGDGDVMTAEMYNSAAEDLNLINVGLNRHKTKLWALEEGSIKLSQPDAVTNNDIDYYCIVPHTSDATNEPGVGDNWEFYWYTGNVSTSETLDSWALDTSYSNGGTIELPEDAISLEAAFLRNDNDDCHVSIINRFQQDAIFSKWETGEPFQAHFNRYSSPPSIQLYFLPDQTDYILFYRYVRKLADISEQGQVPDVPPEWIDFLIYALAFKQSHEYGVDKVLRDEMKMEAMIQLKLNTRDQQEQCDSEFVEPAY